MSLCTTMSGSITSFDLSVDGGERVQRLCASGCTAGACSRGWGGRLAAAAATCRRCLPAAARSLDPPLASAPAAALVFQCASCRAILSDSHEFVCTLSAPDGAKCVCLQGWGVWATAPGAWPRGGGWAAPGPSGLTGCLQALCSSP